MKNIAAYLLTLILFFNVEPIFGQDAHHKLCTDNQGRKLHVIIKENHMAFSVEGKHGLHTGTLKQSGETPLYEGTGTSYGQAQNSIITAKANADLSTIDFTITKDGRSSPYSYKCKDANF